MTEEQQKNIALQRLNFELENTRGLHSVYWESLSSSTADGATSIQPFVP